MFDTNVNPQTFPTKVWTCTLKIKLQNWSVFESYNGFFSILIELWLANQQCVHWLSTWFYPDGHLVLVGLWRVVELQEEADELDFQILCPMRCKKGKCSFNWFDANQWMNVMWLLAAEQRGRDSSRLRSRFGRCWCCWGRLTSAMQNPAWRPGKKNCIYLKKLLGLYDSWVLATS